MMNLLEVIKENKKTILKKALIVGGAIAGLVLVAKMVKPNDEILGLEEVTEIPGEENSEEVVE